ncbi:PP2C family protein-serine/threonine phosphatase [Streptomyces toyocaensis]|uniref:PP2C family protein-serine/threonine phosphatase n=1 Tax=Streptomyces toyocaensis TaxID=55952 RepID=UPI000AB02248|nr:PP2C family protein-serine/threonine phosphatase [Streptomyces toyocaensis]
MPELVIPSPGFPAHPCDGRVSVGPSWKDAPYPVLVLDPSGAVLDANPPARLLLTDRHGGGGPPDVVPSWLTDAHRSVTDTTGTTPAGPSAAGEIGDRFFEAHPSRLEDGSVMWWLVDGTGRRRAETSLQSVREQARTRALVSSTLLSSLNVPRCAEVAAQLAAEHLADAALVVLPPVGRRYPVTHAVRGGPAVHASRQFDPRAVAGLVEALQGFPPVPTRWIDPGSLPGWVVPKGFDRPVGSVIITPLPGHGVSAGALILLRSSTERAFSPDEEAFARLFAARAGAALSAARLYSEQSAITTTLMRDLLPPTLESLHGVEYAGRYRAASDHERVGGDFYDVHPGADASKETFVVLGDVAGKGLEAAVLTGKIRNTLHALLPLASDHEQVLTLLNGALLSSHHTRFATLVLASVRREGHRVRLRVTSAGHMPPLIIRADGRVEEAATHGTLVGALPSVSVRTAEEVLAPGETCLLYTDGITEARGGPLGDELFGEDRLRQALVECAGMPGDAIVERVQMLAAQWLGRGRHDDMATLAVSAPRTVPTADVVGVGGPHGRNT